MLNRIKFFASIVISLALLLCPPALLAEITITAIDVGQGDAVLVQHQSYRVLIDGGGQPNTVADHLSDRGISHLNLVVATHGHADHVRGLVDVLNRQSVDTVLYNGQTHTTLTFENFIDAIADSGADYQEPGRGDSLFYGDKQIQILHPEGSAKDYVGHLHDKNIVVRIVYGDFAAIISGDSEQEGELEILDSGLDVSAQVLGLGITARAHRPIRTG
jgi:competence protein ComEC